METQRRECNYVSPEGALLSDGKQDIFQRPLDARILSASPKKPANAIRSRGRWVSEKGGKGEAQVSR